MKHLPTNTLRWLYQIGIFAILALPILNWSPWFYPADWGKTIVFRSIMALLLFVLLWQFFYQKSEINANIVKKNPIAWGLAALFLVFLAASIFSVDPYFSFWGSPQRSGGFVNFAFYIALAFMVFYNVREESWKKLWDVAIGTGVLVCIVALIQYFSLLSSIFTATPSRPSATLGNPIFLGIYLMLLFFVTLTSLVKEKSRNLKMLYGAAGLIFLFTILITQSRAAYFGIIAGTLTFLFLYPKKSNILKGLVFVFLVFIIGAIFVANIIALLPEPIKNNRIFNQVANRLSIENLLTEGRFPEWTIAINAIADKPIIGWGPENYTIAHDKYYDPKVAPSPWWDRAHNIFLDSAAQAGILGLLAYVFLLGALFWKLYQKKRSTQDPSLKIIITGVQAMLFGYLVANFFSFDSFETYLIFFVVIAYCLHLTSKDMESKNVPDAPRAPWIKNGLLSAAFLLLIIFLWQYNWSPFVTNSQINVAQILVDRQQCDPAFDIMDQKVLPARNFLYAHARIEYVEFTIKCSIFHPENKPAYVKKGFEAIREAVERRPLYTRYWLALGAYSSSMAEVEQDPQTKKELLQQSKDYLAKAYQLSPKHQEVFIEQAKTAIVEGNYQAMKSHAEQCIALDERNGDCWWYLGLSKIYLGETEEAEPDIRRASNRGHDIITATSLGQQADAYVFVKDWQKVIATYQIMITKINPNNPQYHSSLALAYKLVGDYANARKEALTVLRLSPDSKENVDAFLRTLP